MSWTLPHYQSINQSHRAAYRPVCRFFLPRWPQLWQVDKKEKKKRLSNTHRFLVPQIKPRSLGYIANASTCWANSLSTTPIIRDRHELWQSQRHMIFPKLQYVIELSHKPRWVLSGHSLTLWGWCWARLTPKASRLCAFSKYQSSLFCLYWLSYSPELGS